MQHKIHICQKRKVMSFQFIDSIALHITVYYLNMKIEYNFFVIQHATIYL
jgi:hypothetical protein